MPDDSEGIEARIARYRQEACAALNFSEKSRTPEARQRWLKMADALRKLADELSKISGEPEQVSLSDWCGSRKPTCAPGTQ